jgi:serine protease
MFKYIFILLFIFCFNNSYSQEYEKGQLLVEFKEKVDFRNFSVKYSTYNLKASLLKISEPLIPDMNYRLLEFDININTQDFLELLKNDADLKMIQLNHKVSLRSTIPNDAQFPNQWQYINNGQGGGVVGMDLDADLAWDISTGGLTIAGDTIVVAVIDDGANILHPDLTQNLWINSKEIPNNGIDDDANGYVDDYKGWNSNTLNDDVGSATAGAHGTPVAGIIGASGNNIIGVSGVNWKVKIMLIRNNFNTNEANVLISYGYALNQRKRYNSSNGREGAFVVATNASWGIDNAFPVQAPIWCAFYDTLGKYGILNIASTTNNNVNVDIQGDLPTTCPSDFLITVTNINRFGLRNGGYGLQSIDLASFGDGVYTLNYSSYAAFGGTSAAAPHVAAAVALAYSAVCGEFISLSRLYPNQAALLMKAAILNGALPNNSLNNLTVTGSQLNLFRSLIEIQNSCPLDSCFAPYSIQIAHISDSTLDLNWAQNHDSTCIRLRLAGTNTWLDSFVTIQNSHSFQNLARCKNYELFVSAFCNGETGISAIINFQTDGCCQAPTSINLLSTTDYSTNLSWTGPSTAQFYQLRWREYGQASWSFLTVNTNNHQFINLSPCSYYEIQIRTNCTDTLSAYSSSFIFTTTGCSSCSQTVYCDMRGTVTTFDWIESFRLGSYFHRSGNNNGYMLYDSTFFLLTAGQTIDFAVEQGNDFLEAVRIWIDFNRDGDFNDANEKVFEGMINFTDSINGLINIPTNVSPGISRMRVALQWSTYPTLCTQYQNGETEDYCVQFIPGTAVHNENAIPKVSVYPNPTTSTFFVNGLHEPSTIKIFDYSGRLIMSLDNIVGNSIELKLPDNSAPGLYFIEVFSEQKRDILKLSLGL